MTLCDSCLSVPFPTIVSKICQQTLLWIKTQTRRNVFKDVCHDYSPSVCASCHVRMSAVVIKQQFDFYWYNLWWLLFTIAQFSWRMFQLSNHAKGQDFSANDVAVWAGLARRFLMYHHHPMDWLVCCRARWSSFWEILSVPRWGIALVCNQMFRKRHRVNIDVYVWEMRLNVVR